ncbi:hypothetical protein LSAT2_022019 [Lamellibrachia satsuma]|nr:hypothetical protein LSAT2_022019 [Lamellibrachia satsuma]
MIPHRSHIQTSHPVFAFWSLPVERSTRDFADFSPLPGGAARRLPRWKHGLSQSHDKRHTYFGSSLVISVVVIQKFTEGTTQQYRDKYVGSKVMTQIPS